jgi:phage protein D/phage baseplate assembly protein gpV
MPDFTLQTTVEIDGAAIDSALEPLIEQVVIDDNLHQPDMFVLTFRDHERTVLTDARIRIGSRVRISATAVGGNAPEPLIDGEVTAVEAEYTEGGSRVLVRGYDHSHRLHRGLRTHSYAQMKYSDIAMRIAERHRLDVGEISDSGSVHDHVSQINTTDWDFLQARAREIGFEIAVEDVTLHFRRPDESDDAPADGDFDSEDPLQLVFGQDLLEFHPRITSAEQVSEVVVRGWDPRAKQEIVGRAAAAASSATLEEFSPAALATVFGDAIHVAGDRLLSTQAAVDATARALSDRIGSGFAEAVGVARGNPKLSAGAAVSIAVVAKEFAGKYVITQAHHVFDERGYRTRFVVSGRQDRSLLHMSGGGEEAVARRRIDGVVVGLVTANDDPEDLGRVKLKFPWLADDYESDWARMVQLGAGPSSGAVFLPEVGDEVLVAFEFGDVRRPYVVGGLWNGVDTPRLGDGLFDNGSVRRRGFVSRRGHRIVLFDDDRKSGIAFLSADDTLRVALNQTETEIHVRSDGTIVVESQGDLTIKGSSNVNVQAAGTLSLKGSGGVTIESGATVDIDGGLITLN